MSSYNIPITIEKMDKQTEKYSEYYSCRAKVNKVGGKEYENASSNISSSTFDFRIRYMHKIEEILFNTEIYRVKYNDRYFDIQNVDRFEESTTDVKIRGVFNGANKM